MPNESNFAFLKVPCWQQNLGLAV